MFKIDMELPVELLMCGKCWAKGNWVVETKTGEIFCGKCGKKESIFKLDKKQCKEVEKKEKRRKLKHD